MILYIQEPTLFWLVTVKLQFKCGRLLDTMLRRKTEDSESINIISEGDTEENSEMTDLNNKQEEKSEQRWKIWNIKSDQNTKQTYFPQKN